MKSLHISKEISLPIDVVTQTLAAIGRKGAGKTYLATMLAEQMLDAGAQVLVIDPVGNWWGLRVDADGKKKGKEIFVIGGDHGDVPLTPEAGARIAQLVVEKNISAVLDVSAFRLGERKRFCTDFGEELLHLKKSKRTPLHLFLEEAQLIIPQRVGPDEARMVGAFEQIVRLGRNYGIGATLITQRPQSVNKEVLSQVECLCVLQVTGPHERKALEDWVQEVGADRTLIGELPGLARGEGYVWSPSWLRTYQRVHFAKKTTFDASATPEVGKQGHAASLSAVDVAALRKDMADVVAQAEKDDPKALRRQIALLEKEARKQSASVEPKSVEPLILAALARRDREWQTKLNKQVDEWIQKSAAYVRAFKEIEDTIGKIDRSKLRGVPRGDITPKTLETVVHQAKTSPGLLEPRPDGESGITGPEQRILNAIAWLEWSGVFEPEQTAVAFLAGYTYGGGGFNNPKGALRTKGLIEYVAGNKVNLTDAGRAQAEAPTDVLSTEQLHEKVLSVLETPHQRILKPLLENGGEPISKEELASMAGYAFGSGGFNNPLGRLRSLGLIQYLPGGLVQARDILFL